MRLRKLLKEQGGFTLVEIMIVMILSGFIALVTAEMIRVYTQSGKYEKTVENLESIEMALWEFSVREGRYPCPANPRLGPEDADYGIEQCRTAVEVQADPDDCENVPLGLDCANVFTRDGDGNGQPDVVMMGIVPFRTIFEVIRDVPYSEASKKDGYGFMINYAVTENMTHDYIYDITNPVNPSIGALYVIDENNRDVMTPAGSAHYILYSAGLNGRGAYTDFGLRTSTCNITVAPTPGVYIPPEVCSCREGDIPDGLECAGDAIQNSGDPDFTDDSESVGFFTYDDGNGSGNGIECGHGGTYIPPDPGFNGDGIGAEFENCDNNDGIFSTAIRSLGLNNLYNDDLLVFRHNSSRTSWARSFASPPNQTHIYNVNLGNVGVGTPTPTEKLHVGLDLKIETDAKAFEYCDNPGPLGSCFDTEQIAGPGSNCGDPRFAAYAISQGEIQCREIEMAPVTGNCPAGQYLVGISNQGNIHCEAPAP